MSNLGNESNNYRYNKIKGSLPCFNCLAIIKIGWKTYPHVGYIIMREDISLVFSFFYINNLLKYNNFVAVCYYLQFFYILLKDFHTHFLNIGQYRLVNNKFVLVRRGFKIW